MLYMIMEPR